MKKLWLALFSAILGFAPAQAQVILQPPPAGVTIGGCVYNTSPPVLSSGQAGYVQCNANGQPNSASTVANGANVVEGSTTDAPATAPTTIAPATLDALLKAIVNGIANGTVTLGPAGPSSSIPTVSAGYNYTHITTATTTAAIKTGTGVVHTVCVNSLGTVASAITVDDALTATTPTIAVINSLALLGCQTYDVAFSTGLTIVTTGTVAPDVTVSWR